MHEFQTPQPIHVSIEMNSGMVHMIAGERIDTVVTVNPSDRDRPADVDAAEETTVDLVGATLTIRTTKRRGITWQLLGPGRGGSVDVTIELPKHSTMKAEAGVADVRCDGVFGDVDVSTGVGGVRVDRAEAVRIHSGSGRVTVEEASGDAEVVAAGEVTIGSVAGSAEVKALNGTTTIGRVGGKVRVRSANGEVIIDDAGGDVTVKNANGDIRIGQVARGSTVLETAYGGLEIGIPEGTAAWVVANTKFGRIENSLSPTDGPDPSSETVRVRAQTAFGDVLITRP